MITNVMITNVIHVLPSYPRFTLSSAFYSHIRVLPSHPRFTLISVFYPLVRPDIRPSIRPDIRPSVRPYPRFTLTRFLGGFKRFTLLRLKNRTVSVCRATIRYNRVLQSAFTTRKFHHAICSNLF